MPIRQRRRLKIEPETPLIRCSLSHAVIFLVHKYVSACDPHAHAIRAFMNARYGYMPNIPSNPINDPTVYSG